MVLGIQLVGIIFGVAMIYLAFLYYKKRDFTINDFTIWLIVWILFIIAVIFPQGLNYFLEELGVISAMQLFTIMGFIFIFATVFYLFVLERRSQRKLARIVKAIAIKEQRRK